MGEIINGIPQPVNVGDRYVKATYFEMVGSGITSGTITKPAGNKSEVVFVLDEWGSDTDALVSTMANGKPTFDSPVDAGGNTITTTFNEAGEFSFSGTPVPSGDHAVIFVYKCYLKNFDADESLFESEFLSSVAAHAASHVNGTDDIQAATAVQKGLATAAQITKLDGIEESADVTDANNVGSSIHGVDEKATPADADEVPVIDTENSNVLKKSTWAQIKAFLKTYFDTLYNRRVVFRIKEENTSALVKGHVLAITGSSGSAFEVGLCDSNDPDKLRICGLAAAAINQNASGECVRWGLLTEVDTRATNTNINPNGETWLAGDLLWASATPGGMTNVRPVGRSIKVARSLKGSSSSDTLLAICHENAIWNTAALGESIILRGGDNDGATGISVRDYGDNEVAAIDSNGNLTLDGTVDGRDLAADGDKLDGIEASADVTDETNVDAAGATMNADTNVKANSWVIDEDDMSSDLDTKVPTQQSVKAYVDNVGVGGGVAFQTAAVLGTL